MKNPIKLVINIFSIFIILFSVYLGLFEKMPLYAMLFVFCCIGTSILLLIVNNLKNGL